VKYIASNRACETAAPRWIVSALLSLIWVFLAPHGAFAQQSKEADIISEARDSQYDSAGLDKLEPRAINESQGAAYRADRLLSIRLFSGKFKSYSDNKYCKSSNAIEITKCIQYTFIVYLRKNRIFIIDKGFYEGSNFVIVDGNDGNEIEVSDFPEISPLATCIFVMHNSDQFGDGGLEIWAHEGGRFRKEWSGFPLTDSPDSRTLYTLKQWISENSVVLSTETEFSDHRPPKKRFIRFEKVGQDWVLK